eukprot:TRINITY_DN1002_c0_g1_i1.p2 TRINITY_DN1002_c0_g1~~TRINITY_DN1002_c0_g1_i1.p2  ORF type:complete len:52 (+),score=10.18 TRINITY_DN1002_c0_g1_i1:370-525(+)
MIHRLPCFLLGYSRFKTYFSSQNKCSLTNKKEKSNRTRRGRSSETAKAHRG